MVVERFRVSRDGADLVGDRWPGARPRIVLLHAGVCDRRSWHGVVPLLRQLGTVISYDRRGHGDSRPSSVPFTHLDDLFAVLDAVTPEPVWLVGSSMGGGLALDAALTQPQRVTGLVLLAPGIRGAPEPERLDADTQAIAELLEEALQAGDLQEVNELETRVWLDGPAGPLGRVGGPARQLALAMNAIVLSNGMPEDAGASGLDAWSRVEEVAVPTTLAWGERDVPYLLQQCEQLSARIPGARRALLPDTAHLPYLERPDLVSEVIVETITNPR